MNIYLTGMMGCGKTTLGALLAEQAGAEFLDMDAQIVREEGKSIPQIFAEAGEDGFREIETRVLSEIAERDGLVVACGGGVVLLERNVEIMKQSGKIYFIDRAPEEILQGMDMSGRPVLRDGEKTFQEVYKKTPAYLSEDGRRCFQKHGKPRRRGGGVSRAVEVLGSGGREGSDSPPLWGGCRTSAQRIKTPGR